MRNFTDEEIIRLIPMEPDLRAKIMSEFPSYDADRKYEVSRACWDVFHQFRKEVTSVIHVEMMEQIEAGTRQMGDTFAQDLDKAVEDEFNQILNGKHEERSEVENIRSKLAGLMQKS